jgi:hypothetical protein
VDDGRPAALAVLVQGNGYAHKRSRCEPEIYSILA